MLDIGCGTGFVLQGIARGFPKIRLVGSEIYPEGIAFAAKRIGVGGFMQMDARQIPFVAEFDAVGAFDVIEHIEEDETVLQRMHEALKPDGLFAAHGAATSLAVEPIRQIWVPYPAL